MAHHVIGCGGSSIGDHGHFNMTGSEHGFNNNVGIGHTGQNITTGVEMSNTHAFSGHTSTTIGGNATFCPNGADGGNFSIGGSHSSYGGNSVSIGFGFEF